MNKERAEKLAREHTEWFSNIIAEIYYQAFLHGYKHGFKDAKELLRKNEG